MNLDALAEAAHRAAASITQLVDPAGAARDHALEPASTYRIQINGRPAAVNTTTAHSTATTYSNQMCRCEHTTTAHSTATTYSNQMCRCEPSELHRHTETPR